ncbi:uncharacterized protein K452DRAFT_238608 [Aplosporella prunicola CBS 121167]|uniref:Copper transport protein n=1 Tax=Aplosporella prunicola CBS 121167 TaxID=1176127 RepID=A0A6A6AYJ6_9PEZI|nr:uncharacterized protein K452DRAFT_238608 [Aplosporella prunicola CBS 121167]KAF2135847.1 hypothetical protein K452DRAFT_238608 [Aplosporella prunicola CBS 121167]
MNMDAADMRMTFFDSPFTSLFSNQWTPKNKGTYAGTCIFLIVLAVAYRLLLVGKQKLEERWLNQAINRRYVVVADRQPESERIEKDPDSKDAVLSANGVEEHVKMVRAKACGAQPWRFSVDLPRAALVTVQVGVGYLLMLSVMTLNVGYFLSVLGGTFLGEVILGRYNQGFADHH